MTAQVYAAAGVSRRAVLAAGLPIILPARASQRTVLTVAAFALVDEIAKAALPAWQKLYPNVDIQIVSRQFADHHTAMTTALSTSVLLPDVMVLESGFVGRFSQGTGLEDLTQEPYGIARFRDRMVPFAYDQALSPKGAVVAMPTDIGPGTLLYRKDVLERAGVAPTELTQSWESYVAAGVRIKKATGAYLIGHVQTIKDLLIRSGIKPGDGLYFDGDSNVLVQSDRFVHAFEVAREARGQKLDARTVAWSNEWGEGFKRGAVATELTAAWMVGQLSSWIAPNTKGLWRAAPLPGGAVAAYGGSFYALPRRADPAKKALAWQFIQFMTLNRERQLTAFKSYDAFPALLETHSDAFFDAPVDFLGGQLARQLWRDTARKITAIGVHKQSAFADEVVGTELSNVLEHGKSIPLALADAQRLLERRAHR